ncbi:MAG: hypothetical protein HC939_16235 [Pleurocapsa sp. SU_5_0]|nr:hypothetical protein [Pleurocapsa sp. SU_5_0]NJO96647.1 hypothetical protein [Pleurocapsa sp. CRU_1_2]NJR44462.1 hypothetical protein [Hyellaceae cyanobacterium CSU_1_1]
MIVMIADQQILSAQQVCQNCVMSDQSGLPRWHDSKLGCGKMRSRSPKGFALTQKGTASRPKDKPCASRAASAKAYRSAYPLGHKDSLRISPGGASVEVESPQRSKQAQVYECQMGFNVTWIN